MQDIPVKVFSAQKDRKGVERDGALEVARRIVPTGAKKPGKYPLRS